MEAVGVVFLNRGLHQIGEVSQISFQEVSRIILKGSCNKNILLGVLFEALFFGTLLYLMSQAEHDKLASAILVTTSQSLIEQVNVELQKQMPSLSRTDIIESSLTNYGGAFLVDSIEEAIEHIQEHSTHHSDAIISENEQAQTKFSSTIDSAAVYINASTRFTDGGVFGLGCEMGISTQKLHARGPMGLEELCTYKYIIKGNGQIRE